MSEDSRTRTNMLVFSIVLIALHVMSSIVYGVCMVNYTQPINISSIFMCIALAFLTILGITYDIKALVSSFLISKDSTGQE